MQMKYAIVLLFAALAIPAVAQQPSNQCYWVTTLDGTYCTLSPAEQTAVRQGEVTIAQLPAWRQAEYQRQLLEQQAEYQRQMLQQQADIARRQMALQYLMNMPRPTYTPLPPPPMLPAYQNNHINCTTQTLGSTAYTNCW